MNVKQERVPKNRVAERKTGEESGAETVQEELFRVPGAAAASVDEASGT